MSYSDEQICLRCKHWDRFVDEDDPDNKVYWDCAGNCKAAEEYYPTLDDQKCSFGKFERI